LGSGVRYGDYDSAGFNPNQAGLSPKGLEPFALVGAGAFSGENYRHWAGGDDRKRIHAKGPSLILRGGDVPPVGCLRELDSREEYPCPNRADLVGFEAEAEVAGFASPFHGDAGGCQGFLEFFAASGQPGNLMPGLAHQR